MRKFRNLFILLLCISLFAGCSGNASSGETSFVGGSKEQTSTEKGTEESTAGLPELWEEAMRSLSTFAVVCKKTGYALEELKEPDEALMFLYNYVNASKRYGVDGEKSERDLPFDWVSGTVSRSEAEDFLTMGLGVELPDGYRFELRGDYGELYFDQDGMQSTFDAMNLLAEGGEVRIVSRTGELVEVEGIGYAGNFMDDEVEEVRFAAKCQCHEIQGIFGGLTVLELQLK